MSTLSISGGVKLKGNVYIDGAKNSVLALIPAALLFDGNIEFINVPNITDVDNALMILDYLGVNYQYSKNKLLIESRKLENLEIPNELSLKYRASYYFTGAFLGRYKKAYLLRSGGCDFGNRPIDYHIKSFTDLGGVLGDNGLIEIKNNGENKLTMLEKKSVGTTINAILASVYLPGVIIGNASQEPEIDDLIEFLQLMDIDIVRDENNVVIKGKKNVCNKSVSFPIMADRIEAGTYITLGLLVGDLKIYGACYKHLRTFLYTLIKANASIQIEDDIISVRKSKLSPLRIETSEYPGFPTDLQPVVSPLLALYGGSIEENIYENRFRYLEELKKMGAIIELDNNQAFIYPSLLEGNVLTGTDLRGTASLLLAGLATKGKSLINNIELIERGYSNIYEKLNKIGAVFEKI